MNNSFIYGIQELDQMVAHIRTLFDTCSVFTFTGSLGAGKTTFIQKLLRESGVEGPITSPTFTYVNVYTNDDGQTVDHFDCYRLGSVDDFLAAGFGEYLYQPNSWSFIEWPDVVKPLLQQKVCHIAIEYYGEDKRKLTYQIIE